MPHTSPGGIQARYFKRSKPGEGVLIDGMQLINTPGKVWYADSGASGATRTGETWSTAFTTIQAAVNAARNNKGDVIYVAPGAYDEQVTIASKNKLTIVGVGGRGSSFIQPTASNPTALTVKSTDVTLINIGAEGSGTGGGLYIHADGADVRRFRAYASKFEGGAFAAKITGTGTGNSVGDTIIRDCEFAWATDGLLFVVGAGGDVVTETWLDRCIWHDITTDCVRNDAADENIWLTDCFFLRGEGDTEPTQFLDIDTAGTTGIVTGCRFQTTVHASAKIAIAAGVHYAGNFAEAEGPATGGGTSGRPD